MKKSISIILAVVIVFSTVTMGLAETTDYENSWAKDEIDYMKEKEILQGDGKGNFRPTSEISKSEFYRVINCLIGYSEKAESLFLDVNSWDWFYEEVQKGLEANYIKPSKFLNPKESITRGEVAKIIAFVFDVEEDEKAAEFFKDSILFPKELTGIIGGLKGNDFINGFPDKTFRPEAKITRAEVVKMLYNISGEIINKAGTISKDVETNVIVNTADVLLKDMVIERNLYLTEGIGKGDVILDNVEIKGDLIIKGGGTNGIIIRNSKLNKLLINKQKGLVRVVIENSTIDEIKALNEAKLVLTDKTDVRLVNLNGKINLTTDKESEIATLDIFSNEIVIDSKGTIGFLKASEKIEVNNKKIKPNTEYKVDKGKVIEVKAPSKPKPRPERDDDYYLPPKPDPKPEAVPVSDIKVNKSTTTLVVGAAETITATVVPGNASNKKVLWTSSKDAIATVDANGKVTAVAEGIATITVTSVADSSKKETVGVTVIAKPITKHTVTFVDHDDSVLKTEKVEEGKAATAPADPIRTGYTFTGWDVDFSNVTSDLMVKAKYTEDSKPVPVSAITVTGANTVVKAKTLQMGVDITPTTATNKKVIWSVIDGTGSATISSSGLLTATKVGTVTVKAVAQDGSGKEGIKEIIITAAPVTVTGVTIKTPPTKVTYIEGENLELAGLVVTLAKSDSSTEDVAFSDFGSKGITTVKANGAILGVGDTKVTISVNGQTVYQAITVNPSTVAVTGVILNKSTLNLTVGATETITATVQPTNASNKNVTWTSSDEAIATVDNTGKIEAVAVGTATITVTSVADSSKKATVEVIVLTETSEEYFVFEQATGTITGYKDEGPKNIAIPAKIDGVDVKVIGAEAFAKKELTSVVIPNSVKTIKEYAFLENKLISINIPTSVTSIGALAFTDNQLPDDQAFIYARNSDGTEDKTVVINYGGEKREDVVIPDSVVTIEEGAFASNELTSIAIPNSVTIIGKTAFAHNELLSINIPNSVTDIGEGAYQYNKLTSVMIPESVTTLGDNAFQKNGPDSESGNIPTTEFVGSWKLIGTEWERDYKLAQDTDFSGTTNGEFKYIGTDEYVEIPYEINGVPVTSYKNMFEGTSVVGVKSTKLNITSMEGMFKDSQATVLDLSDFNTSSDPNMDGMFTGSTAEKGYARTTEDADRFNASSGKPDGLTFVAKEGESYVEAVDSDFSGTEDGEFRYIGSNQYVEIPHVIKGVPVTSYYKMFEGTSVKGVKSNNENVTNMSNMFYKSQASSLDLSNFDTSNVTDMSGMFRQSQATSVDLSSFDTSNVVDMFFMFNRSQARSLDLSKFDTSKVESMGRMFQNSQATVLDLSNFNTSNVITMEFMFDGSQANSLNLSSFDTSKVTTMNCMFKESQASSLDLSNFDTSNVTNMRSMFKNSQATVLDLSKFDTSNVTEIEEMFYGSQASTLDLSSFNTSKIITMNRMFKESQASTLDLSSFDTSKVKYMRDMFNGSQAALLDLSSFDTSNVTDMLGMFRESKATILDLSSFDTSKVEYTTEMFLDSKATTGYARTQKDANKFNESSEKPAGLNFVVKDAPTVPVSNIKLTPESLELTVGGELGIIIATVEPSNATNKNVTWASSDDTKATVDANGKVKGVAAGTATITVTTEDGSRTATVSVKVKGERIKINKIVATSTIDTPIHGTDVEIERPTFTVIEGSPAYFYVNSGNGWWEKKNGDNWEQVSSGTFSEGRWRFRCRVRIDGKTTQHIYLMNLLL